MKARRNRIHLQKRRPRIRMSNPAPVAWIRGRFVDIPLTQELLEDAGVSSAEEWNRPTWAQREYLDRMVAGNRERMAGAEVLEPTFLERLRERFRILGWIFRLLRR